MPVTGRLSSAEPNAQNVAKKPIHLRTCGCDACVKDWRAGKLIGPERVPGAEHALSIRRYFTVRPGYARIFIDLSQIELRILAWYSRDRLLLDAYANDRDIHAITAEEVTSGDRDIAKQVNFGNSYGMTEIGLAKRMAGYYEDPHGTRLRAKVVLAKFFATYEGIPVFRKNLANHMRLNNGMFVSVMGRPRRIEEILAREEWVRERGERMMMSSAISGTAADINKEIMIRNRRYLAQRFPSDQHVGLRQTVHDECMYDVPTRPPRSRTFSSRMSPRPRAGFCTTRSTGLRLRITACRSMQAQQSPSRLGRTRRSSRSSPMGRSLFEAEAHRVEGSSMDSIQQQALLARIDDSIAKSKSERDDLISRPQQDDYSHGLLQAGRIHDEQMKALRSFVFDLTSESAEEYLAHALTKRNAAKRQTVKSGHLHEQ